MDKRHELRRRERTQFKIERGRRKVEQPREKGRVYPSDIRNKVCAIAKTKTAASQSPLVSAVFSKVTSSLSTSAALRPSRLVVPSAFSFCLGMSLKSKRVSFPGRVGRKKGARSGAFGGWIGRFRCYGASCQLVRQHVMRE
jgi:hypothetical protein